MIQILNQLLKNSTYMIEEWNDFKTEQIISNPNMSGMITKHTPIDKDNGTEILSICCGEKAVIFGTHHETELCPKCKQHTELKNGWRRVL